MAESMKAEYDYALTHETPAAVHFRDLAHLYQRATDPSTLGLLRGAAAEVLREMAAAPAPAESEA